MITSTLQRLPALTCLYASGGSFTAFAGRGRPAAWKTAFQFGTFRSGLVVAVLRLRWFISA